MKHIIHHDDYASSLWRKLPLDMLSAVICIIVLHALGTSLMSDQPHINGSYLALACVGCIMALLAAFFNDNHIRKLQASGYMIANLIAMFCFY